MWDTMLVFPYGWLFSSYTGQLLKIWMDYHGKFRRRTVVQEARRPNPVVSVRPEWRRVSPPPGLGFSRTETTALANVSWEQSRCPPKSYEVNEREGGRRGGRKDIRATPAARPPDLCVWMWGRGGVKLNQSAFEASRRRRKQVKRKTYQQCPWFTSH